ncbi:MAG TPA: SRPBCC domain-containing protein [Gaiellaceae bacterium]|nr:SRPBCC domain-containing protein [Gaiellaceae bacterium]
MAEHEIQDTITVDAAPERVFRALTAAEALEQWMATRVESDAKTGGRFRYEFEFDDAAQNNAQEGEYLAIEADRRVALPWVFPFSPKQTNVEFLLESADSGTRVDFTHSGFGEGEPWDGARERFTGGWRMFLDSLKRHVETGVASHPLGIKSRR